MRLFSKCAVAVGFLCLSSLATASVTSSSGAESSPFSPALVARAGDSNVLYVLSQSPACTLRECIRLERSNNGGQSFFSVAVPDVTPVLGMNGPLIDGLYFATPNNGYMEEYASTGTKWTTTSLFSTVDGGRTWRSVSIAPHASLYGFTTSAHFFYALTQRCTAKGRCDHVELYRSGLGSTTWTPLSIPSVILKYSGDIQVAAYGSAVWLSTQDQTSAPFFPYLATSHDDGVTFAVTHQPLLQSVGACGILPTSETILWAECDDGMMQGDILFSNDGGTHWGAKGQLNRFGFGVFDPVATQSAYFINELHAGTLFHTTSGLAASHATGTLPKNLFWVSLNMTSGSQGLALSQGLGGSSSYLLWRTSDEGAHWSRVSLPDAH
jgi:photosystem II stability/assembly factor-like uncharacterized protein